MKEIIFYIEEAQEGGYTASAINYSIFTQGDTIEELKLNIRDAVTCHLETDEIPPLIRLHFVHQEILAIA